ncbi:MAG: dimethylargininase [Fidelibacterota bacterium]|nr:MAG: dimethylargininase [Candidatus Neomarinimicrobiota bacterium]
MKLALTHAIPPKINDCQLTHLERQPIDLKLAEEQHAAYCDTLRSRGLKVIELDVNTDYPDGLFVEDIAVVLDELAIMANPGAETRRGEVPGIEMELAKYRDISRIEAPATLDGGDVLVVGKRVFVGLSIRTNRMGAGALQRILKPLGYQVHTVRVKGVLHLKSAITAIDEATLLCNPHFIDSAPFANFRLVTVAANEPWAANALPVGGIVLLADGFPFTAEKVTRLGYRVQLVDIREIQKAEGGLTCSSIIFRADN